MMGKAVTITKQLSPEEKEWALKERLAEARFIERDALSAEYEAGKAEGRAEARAENRERFKKILIGIGLSEDEIAKELEELDKS